MALYGQWCPGWRRDGHSAQALTADHVIPKSKGGTDDRSNLAVLCHSCNSAKRDR
ncbi:HNH endonuclease [Longispora fulva]|uniref:HNH endonuclease n=1 Tax=Longispora fulva TaxID=619741 RepID=UPI002278A6D3|nr:HNH endonuclease signature motif containing protein [Longispora fulva]